ncbi:MAG: cupin domain-containing protein [Proteobacteria bacterium]|nr:cupin domain-containing protein [Pseudomonadota bacterium]MBI3497737.1 cupin domain-containing protein [Pseudomonadota bacterium]
MTGSRERPAFIRHYREIERSVGENNLQAMAAPFGSALGLARIGVNQEIIQPGHRSSFPHAHSEDEEFVFVVEGHPDVWIDGDLYGLEPGDGVAFPAGTGIAHCFINNSGAPVRLLIVGERRPEDRVIYPVNPERRERPNWWHDAPQRPLGAHDGRPTPRRR